MKAFISLFSICFVFLISPDLSAKVSTYSSKKLKAKSNLKKNMNFRNHLVNGKYLHSQSATAIIEEDKNLSDLLGLRHDFKDRQKDLTRRY